MHFVTAYQWVGYVLKPIQLEYPDPPAVFDDFLHYNGFRNIEAFHLGEASPVPSGNSAGNISIAIYRAEQKTTSEFGNEPKFLASLDIADTNMLILLDSPGAYISFLNAYSPLLVLPLLRSIQKDLGKLAKRLKEIDSPRFSAGGAGVR
jgi:hypothetical protein